MYEDNIYFFNTETQKQIDVKYEPFFFDNINKVRVVVNGEKYKLVSTKPAKQQKLEKLLIDFGEREFPRIANKYPEFGKVNSDPTLPEGVRGELLHLLNKKQYRYIKQAVREDNTLVDRLLQAFVQFVVSTRTIKSMDEDLVTRRLDTVYLLDYLKRYMNLISTLCDHSNPPTKKTIGTMFDAINNDISIDNRRPLGRERIINSLEPLMSFIKQNKKAFDDMKLEDVYFEYKGLSEEDWKKFEDVLYASGNRLTDLINFCNCHSEIFAGSEEPKLQYHTKAILKLHKGILEKYSELLRGNYKDKDDTLKAQTKFVEHLHTYVDNVIDWGVMYVCDRRPIEPFYNKMLELQYDNVFYFIENQSKDENWIVGLMKSIGEFVPYLQKAVDGTLKVPTKK